MAQHYEQITAEFDYEKNVFGSADDRTIIGLLADSQGTIVKGKAREGSLETGLTYRFHGYWTEHPRWGRQFTFAFFELAQPSGKRGTIAYLQRGPGIGRARALAIYDLYGADSLEMLRTNPAEVAERIKGLTPEKAIQAAAYFTDHRKLEGATKDLLDLGLNRKQIEWAIGQFGPRASLVLRENMYVLMQCRGTGFNQAHRLYLACGGDPAAVHCVGWCAWNALNRDTDGSTWRPLVFCLQRVEQEISGVDAEHRAGIEWAVAERKIVLAEREGKIWAATFARASAEQLVAGELHRSQVEGTAKTRQKYPTIVAAEEGQPGPSRHQVAGIEAATAGTIGILAGRPGTGKTYLLAEIIKRLRGSYAVCGPTGKSAVRITESLALAGVRGARAKTIHALLKMGPDGAPEYNQENPLSQEVKFIFVDESSMIDTTLMAHLLAARGSAAVLFSGDPGQLSPVGHGAPLRDLIAAGAPCGMLTEIRRNAGRIVQACKEIAETRTFEPSPRIDLAAGENLGWIECGYPDQQIEKLKSTLERMRGMGLDVIRDCQVIVAVNKKSPLSRKAINDLLQKFLNPDGQQVGGNPFRVGDKVVCLKNGSVPAEGKQKQETADANNRIRVANGEQAIVVAVAPRYTVARMEYPGRLIRIPQGEVGGGDRDEDSKDEDAEETGCEWQLAYGITLHKAQGSDWRVVIPLIDGFSGAMRLCKREWPYTAFSRAKELTIGIGRLSVAQEMCRTSGLADRKTFLVETVRELEVEGVGREWERDLAEMGL